MNNKYKYQDWLIAVLVVILDVTLISIIETHLKFNPYDDPPTQTENVDSLLKSNDSIKNIIIELDTIKIHEIQKVNNLSNDSTIELFKQLVKE